MFTGIIQALGVVAKIEDVGGDKRVYINAPNLPLDDAALGDSIAVCGVCLTAIEFEGNGFWVDVSKETIDCTRFADIAEGSKVNLEKSLTPSTALGGHLVTGHVDGLGEIVEITPDARSTRFLLKAPAALAKFVAAKGSICIDGTSLTVNHVNGAAFDVNIIPHTLEHTLFGEYQVGTRVNLEVDIIARYVERMSQFSNNASN